MNQQLTERQQHIIELRLDGLYYKEIARKLGIKQPTVANEIHRIYVKLNVCNMAQLRAWSHEQKRQEVSA